MTDESRTQNGETLVPGAHRRIRMLDAGEGPFAGELVTCGGGVAVSVDAEQLSGWEGWRFAGADHVAAPRDLVRRIDGHDVLLPWCPETVAGFVARRTAADVGLSAGETATLVVSMLRGLEELDGGVRDRGRWWLTDEGRPVFAFGDGATARQGAARIAASLRDSCSDRPLVRVLAAIQEGLEEERVPRAIEERWEGELCDLAAPRSLRREVFPAERARDVAPRRALFDDSRERRRDRRRDAPTYADGPIGRMLGRAPRILGHLEERCVALREHLAGAVSSPGSRRASSSSRPPASPPRPARRRGAPSPRRGGASTRRRALLVGAAAAASVLAMGLLWPSGTGSGADAQTEERSAAAAEGAGATAHRAAASATPSATETADPGTGTPPDAATGQAGAESADAGTGPPEDDTPARRPESREQDPVAAAASLVEMIEACRASGDSRCEAAVADGAPGVVDALDVAGRAEFALVDVYGDVAVIRRGADSEAEDVEAGDRELMLVLIRRDEKWLVRDVYDVADQPS